MFIRLKPYNPKLGQNRKTYSLKGLHFVAGGPAIEVTDPDHIARLRAHKNEPPKETLAFECSEKPFDAEDEIEETEAPAPAPARGKPGPKPGSKRKTERGTVPSLEG